MKTPSQSELGTNTNPASGFPIRAALIRAFSFGTALCGFVIVYNGVLLHARSAGPFKENLDALSGTIKELDKTIVDLRGEIKAFDGYVGALMGSLKQTKRNIDSLNKETGEFVGLVGTKAPELIANSSDLINDAAKALRETADQLGYMVPWDLAASQRAIMYKMAGTAEDSAKTLGSAASDVGRLAGEIGGTTRSSLQTAGSLLNATNEQIGMLKDGTLQHVPAVMESTSKQLKAHLQIIDSSYDLVRRVTIPLVAVGLCFVFVGLRGLLLLPRVT